jgi:hypothetical protein
MAAPPFLKRVSKSIARANGHNDGYRGFGIRLPQDPGSHQSDEVNVAAMAAKDVCALYHLTTIHKNITRQD